MNELETRYSEGIFAARNPEFYAQEQAEKQSMLDQAIAAAKGVGTIASGIAASAPAGVAGLAALPFKGLEGANQLIEDIQTALTYIPKDEAGQQMVQRIGGALEQLGVPAQWVGEKVLDATGSPLAATAAELVLDPVNIAGAGAAAAIKPAAKAVGKVAKKAAENAAKAPSPPSGSLAAQRGAVGDLSVDDIKMEASDMATEATIKKHGTTSGAAAENTYKTEYLKAKEELEKKVGASETAVQPAITPVEGKKKGSKNPARKADK